MANTSVFNSRRHKLLRKDISAAENWITIVIFFILAGIVVWVAAQKHHYNPADRDVSVDLLRQASTQTQLYVPPLKSWVDPENSSLANTQTPDLGPFPGAILDQQWQATGRVKQFDAENLYEKINGEAPKFLKQGFQAMHYVVLKSNLDASEIAIELYDQGDMGGSMGIFSEHLGADNTIEQENQVVFFRTSIGIIGRKGRFFFRVAGDSDSDPVRQKARQLATAFAQLAEQQTAGSVQEQPEELRILRDAMDIPEELITFQQQNVFQYDFVENVWFGQFTQDTPERLFIHRAASAQQARQLFELLLEEQSYEYKTIEQNDDNAIFWHEFLQNHFALGLHGHYLFGSENTADQATATAILERFIEILSDG